MKSYIIIIACLSLFSCYPKNKNLDILKEIALKDYPKITPLNRCECLVTEYGSETLDTIITKINFKYLESIELKMFKNQNIFISQQRFVPQKGISIVKIVPLENQNMDSALISKIKKNKIAISFDHSKEGRENANDFIQKIKKIAKNCGASLPKN